jgi:pimeloyl-ACP methyl ester carboxylesterase
MSLWVPACRPCLQAIEAKMTETTVTIDGVRSPLLEFGPPNASEAVVFVHGNPGSNRDWESLARGMGQIGRAVATDMPGCRQARAFRLQRARPRPPPGQAAGPSGREASP